MSTQYRRLAVFVDNPSDEKFLWIVMESTEDPAVWLDLETAEDSYDSWIQAHEAGNTALMAYVDDESIGPVITSAPGVEDLDDR
jgi:hypothetical protein